MSQSTNDPASENRGNPAPEAQTTARKTGVIIERSAIVGILYLANFFLSFSVFVGVVLAYIWRSDAETEEWEKTHFTYLIRTFWVGFALGFLLIFTWIGSFFMTIPFEPGHRATPEPVFFFGIFGVLIVGLLLAVWYGTRCILSLIKAAKREPMPKPETWLF